MRTNTMTEQPHRTVNEVAALIRMHRNTVLSHISRGDFPGAYRSDRGRGGTWRIPQSAVDAYIERGTPTPNDG
jgi:excisionase family DNA binding protein